MKNRILILIGVIVFVFILSMIIPIKVKKWTFNLPNNYLAAKVNNDSVIIGKYINNKLVTKKEGKTIGISEYVEAFAYNDKYIYARTLMANDNNLSVNYYLIDSSLEKVDGPFELEGFLDQLKKLELSEEIDWTTSSSMDSTWKNLEKKK